MAWDRYRIPKARNMRDSVHFQQKKYNRINAIMYGLIPEDDARVSEIYRDILDIDTYFTKTPDKKWRDVITFSKYFSTAFEEVAKKMLCMIRPLRKGEDYHKHEAIQFVRGIWHEYYGYDWDTLAIRACTEYVDTFLKKYEEK